MEFACPDCLRDSLFQASFSHLPSSRLSSRLSHRPSASPRPSLDRRNADAGTAAPSHHQATTREIGRGNRQTAEVSLDRECHGQLPGQCRFSVSRPSAALGWRSLPSLQHLVIHGAPSLLPGVRQRALGILPHWLPPSVPCPSVSPHKQPHVEGAYGQLDYTNHQPSLSPVAVPWKHLERQPLVGVFLFPGSRPGTRYVIHHWSSADCRSSQARGRPFLARERVPAARRPSRPVSGGGL